MHVWAPACRPNAASRLSNRALEAEVAFASLERRTAAWPPPRSQLTVLSWSRHVHGIPPRLLFPLAGRKHLEGSPHTLSRRHQCNVPIHAEIGSHASKPSLSSMAGASGCVGVRRGVSVPAGDTHARGHRRCDSLVRGCGRGWLPGLRVWFGAGVVRVGGRGGVDRYTAPDEHAFFPVACPAPMLPPLDMPRLIAPNSINIGLKIMR